MTKQVKFIAAMGIVEFAQEIQKAFDEGYRFDFEDNARVPSTFGALMEATMVKDEVKAQEETEVKPQVEAEVKVDGRKRKAKAETEVKAEGGADA